MKQTPREHYLKFIYGSLSDATMLVSGILVVLFAFLGHSAENGLNIFKSAYQTLALVLGNYDFRETSFVGSFLLYVAVALTPFFYAGVFIKLLGKKLRLWYFLKFHSKDHIVICGLGDMGFALAKDILSNHAGEKLLAVDINSSNENLNRICKLGAFAVTGDAIDAKVLDKINIAQAKKIILLTGNDVSNLEILNAISKKLNVKADIYIHLESKENYEFLPSFKKEGSNAINTQNNKAINIKSFSVYDNAAQTLFMKHPIGENVDTMNDDDRSVNFAIVGFDAVGLSVLYRALNLGHFFNGKPLNVTVFDSNPEEKKANFLKLYPISLKAGGIINWNIDFKYDGEIFNSDGIKGFDQIVFCKTSVQESLADIARIVKNQSKYLNKNQQFFIFTDKHDGIKDISNEIKSSDAKKNIIPFGSFSQICSYDVIVNEAYDEMAIQANKRYDKLHEKESNQADKSNNKPLEEKSDQTDENKDKPLEEETQDSSQSSWDKLTPFLQDSNRMQVEHLPIKLKILNKLLKDNKPKQTYDEAKREAELRWLTLDGMSKNNNLEKKLVENEVDPWNEDTENEDTKDTNKNTKGKTIKGAKILAQYLALDDIEKIARMEKNRWNAFHILNGWTTLLKSNEQDYPYRKNKDTKEHPCLVRWEDLIEVSKDIVNDDNTKKNCNYKGDDVETVMRAYDMIISAYKDDKISQEPSEVAGKDDKNLQESNDATEKDNKNSQEKDSKHIVDKDVEILEDKDSIYCEEIFKFKKKIEELKKVDK
jgi:probable glutathione-regulated potassium-efflux system protein kefB